MKKNLFILVILLSLVPACKQKKANIGKTSDLESVNNRSLNSTSKDTCKDKCFDDDLEAFVLEEDNNPFQKPVVKADESSEELEFLEDEDSMNLPVDQKTETSKQGFKTVYYKFNQYDLNSDQESSMSNNIQHIKTVQKNDPKSKILVEGHACNSAGSDSYNLMLSAHRAQEAANYLVKKGIDKKSIKVVGRGSEMPIVQNGDKDQQAPNRRVELFVRRA